MDGFMFCHVMGWRRFLQTSLDEFLSHNFVVNLLWLAYSSIQCQFQFQSYNFFIFASIHREIKEVLGLLMKKGNHLEQTSYQGALWIHLEGNTQALLAILTGVIGMVYAKQTKVFLSQHS